MLNTLIHFSLRQRFLILALAAALLAVGLWKVVSLPVEVLPDLTKPTVIILTEAPGYAPEEVETLVSIPLESALMGVAGVTRLRTINDISLSLIYVEFDWGTDIYQARQFVQERLTGATEALPDGVTPYLTPVASLMGNIMLLGVVDPSGKTGLSDLRSLSDWTIARQIQSIPGIAEVLNMGGGVKQIQIQPRPGEMLALDISFDQLREAAGKAVSNTTGGFLTEGAQEIMVRNLAMTTDLAVIADAVVDHRDDRAIRIGDVAEVVWGTEPMRGDAAMGSKHLAGTNHEAPEGFRGVIVSITKSPDFDTIALTERIEKVVAELKQTLPAGVEVINLYRQADFIELAIGNLEEALRDGAIMVAVVLFLFLFNFRITLITLTAIPLSLGIAVIVFDLMGQTVNSMTLGGFAVAIGMVVDDAIVDVENVYRRLREWVAGGCKRTKLEIIAAASSEVRSSILYATVLVILVFVPLLALSGVEGRLFAPIAIATIVSMAASFVVSLTVIPVLSSFLLHPKPSAVEREGWFIRNLKRVFAGTLLRLALAQPLLVLAVTAGLLVLTAFVYGSMGGNFLPPFREPTAVVATTTAPGTSLKQTTELADRAVELLLQIPEVETVGYRAGRAERGDHVVPVSTAEFDVEFSPTAQRSRTEILSDIRDTMRGIPGTFSAISGPLADRVGHMLSGVSAKVALKIYGPELDELLRLGNEVAGIARSIPGLEEARLEQQAPIPQLRIEVDRKRALAYGISPGELNRDLADLMGGAVVGEVYEGQQVYEMVVRLPASLRESPERLGQLSIDTKSGQRIPLSSVAEIRQATGPNTILRENTQRRIVVSINPTASDLNRVVEELTAAVKKQVRLPQGYRISYEGEYQAQADAKRRIMLMSIVILGVVIFLLYSYFQSAAFVALVLTNIPISLVGGVLLTSWTLGNVSIATLVGFIAISGIAARNSIMMISHYLHLMRHEGESFDRAMVVRGTLERLVPVLMTALSAGIALIPLVLASEDPGKEILNPIAIVIVGGLVSSTLLGLAVTPAVFLAFCRRPATAALERGAAAAA